MLAPRLSQNQVLGEGGRGELNANGARELGKGFNLEGLCLRQCYHRHPSSVVLALYPFISLELLYVVFWSPNRMWDQSCLHSLRHCPPCSRCWHLHWWRKCGSRGVNAWEAAPGIVDHHILTVFAGSLFHRKCADEATQIILLNLSPLCTSFQYSGKCPWAISIHTKPDRFVEWAVWVRSWPLFKWNIGFIWKNDWQTNYCYSECGIWSAFSQKWLKRTCHFNKNNWRCLLPMTEFEPSSENENLGTLCTPLRVWQFLHRLLWWVHCCY